MKRFSRRGAALGVVLGMGLAAGSASSAAAASEPGGSDELITAKVGVIGPRSGAAQYFWREMTRGIELALPDIESTFGVTFEIVEADDQGSPDVASRVIQTLLNQENVDAVFGPSQSGPSLQVAETIQRTGRPWLVPIAAADQILNPDADPNWGFRTNNNNADAIAVSADYLWGGEDASVGILYGADAYGQSNRDMLAAYAAEHGLTIHEEAVQPGATDVTAEVQRLADAGVNSVLVAVTTGADTAAISRAMDQIGYQPDRFLVTATVLADYIDLAQPREWENLVFIEPRDLTAPSFTELVDRYVAAYGEEPISIVSVYTTYTAVTLYAQAVADVGDPTDWPAVRQAMEDTPRLEVLGRVWDEPFAADDHDLYEDDAASWFLIGFDPDGNLRTIGPAAG